MRLTLAVMTFLIFVHPAVTDAAPTPQDKRRIEEQKRHDLESKKPEAPAPSTTGRKAPLSPEDTRYILEMSTRRVTYNYDLTKLIVILQGVENDYIALDAQVRYLQDNDYLPRDKRESFDPMKPLRRGLTAYVLRKVLNIKGGIFLHVFSESERYALKELSYEGVMPSGNTNEIIGGDELASSITQAIHYKGGR